MTPPQTNTIREFPVPKDAPDWEAFTQGLSELYAAWPFSAPALPAVNGIPSPESSAPTSTEGLLRGRWTQYPTYCLISWPVPSSMAAQDVVGTLKHVLVACHLLLCDGMERADKHYQSRLQESFRLFRQVCAGQHTKLLTTLPNAAESLGSYANSVRKLTEAQTDDATLDVLQRSLDGALAGSGGYTRQAGEATSQEVVGRREHTIQAANVQGRVTQNQTSLNSAPQCATLRLANDEAATGTVHYQSARNIVPSRGDNAYQAVRAAKGKKASIERLNQLHGFGWERLTLFDIQQWHWALPDSTQKAAAQLNLPADEIQAINSLMFWLGRDAETICDIRIVANYDCLPATVTKGSGYLVASPLVAVLPRYEADGAKAVSRNWAAYVHESADRIYLPLPSAARCQIAPLVERRTPSGHKGMRLFQQDSERLMQAARETLKNLRKRTGARVTTVRLIRQIPIAIANHCGDRVMAATTMGIPIGNNTFAGAYYYSALQADLAKNYWRSAAPLSAALVAEDALEREPPLPQSVLTARVGSNVCPDDGAKLGQQFGFYHYHVQDLLAALSYTRSRRHEPAFTVAFHNIYTTYCISMLAAATGYRAVKQPLQDIRALDCDTGWLVISDKDYADQRHTRLVWVPPIVSQQLQAYATYRGLISRLLGLAKESAGYFFFLNTDRHSKPVAPHSLAPKIAWTNRLPLNANRHFLRTRLTEKQVPGEVIDAYMGHWDLGEEPYGPYSAMSPRDFKDCITPALNEILDKQGWRIEYAVTTPLEDTSVEVQGTGPTKQAQPPKGNIRASRDQDLQRLDEILEQQQPGLLQRDHHLQLDDKDIDAVFDELRSATDLKDWRYVHNTLVRRLENGTEKLGWDVKIPAPVVVLNRPAAPFTIGAFRLLADFRQLESKFRQSLRELAPQAPDINTIIAVYTKPSRRLRQSSDLATLLVGQILFSAARYGGLVARKSIDALASQLTSGGMRIRNHLAFDLAPRDHTIRWYADPLTATLILRYRALVDTHKLQATNHPADHMLRVFIRGLAAGKHRLDNTPTFLQAASTAWRLNQPAFVYRWSSGLATSASWDMNTEMRVRLGRRLKREIPNKQADTVESASAPELKVVPQKRISRNKRKGCNLNRAYRELYSCLHVKRGRSWRGQVSSQVKSWIAHNEDQAGLVPVLMAHWIIAIALRKSKAHTAIGAASSLRTYVSRIGRDLFVSSGGFPDHHYTEITPWKALYKTVVDAKKGHHARQAAAAECQGFHNFVIRSIDVPPLDVGEAVGIGPVSTSVSINANYITPDEAMRAASWLAQAGHNDKRYEVASQALTLAYWSGLRIGELAGLRLGDVQIVWGTEGTFKRVELLVRAHYHRSLKTDTSLRRVPISCLMPKPQLHLFVRFFHRRERQCEGLSKKGKAFLFATSGLETHMPDEDDIRTTATHVLRAITGDDSIVFHHLRHAAANNWLLALMARSDSDPLWDLFPAPPEPLLDVASRINRGLMINPNRRRGILYAVATLLGHSDPSMTLQNYIHVLPWICAAATISIPDSEKYPGLARSTDLDASLLDKTPNATRSWRSRHSKDEFDFDTLAVHWLDKSAANTTPTAYKNTVAQSIKIELPKRPLPSVYTPYKIALQAQVNTLGLAATPSTAQPATIATQLGEPLWLVSGLLATMRGWGNASAGRKIKEGRSRGKNRFQDDRKKHLRGHGRNSTSALERSPEIPGLMPAPPHTQLDRDNCNEIWRRLGSLLRETGQWDALTTGESPPLFSDSGQGMLLKNGLSAFLRISNSSDHTMRFFKTGPEEAQRYLALVIKAYPKNRILVEIKPPPGVRDAKAIAGTRKQFGLTNVTCVATEPTKRAYPKWPHGLPCVKLLPAPYDKDSQPRVSYGAWFGLYSFALLQQALEKAVYNTTQLKPSSVIDTNQSLPRAYSADR